MDDELDLAVPMNQRQFTRLRRLQRDRRLAKLLHRFQRYLLKQSEEAFVQHYMNLLLTGESCLVIHGDGKITCDESVTKL